MEGTQKMLIPGIFGRSVPYPIRWILGAMMLLMLLHAIDAGILIAEYSTIVGKIMNAARESSTTLTEGQLYLVGKWLTISAILYHLFLIALFGWFVRMVARGSHLARIILSVALVLNFIGSLYTFGASPLFVLQGITVFGWLLHIALIAMLWIPDASEEYFEQ